MRWLVFSTTIDTSATAGVATMTPNNAIIDEMVLSIDQPRLCSGLGKALHRDYC